MKYSEISAPYQDTSYDDLLIYVVMVLSKSSKTGVEWQDIVITAHQLFPKRFGLPHYENKHPDSAQVDRSILRCRDKRYLTGRRSQDYSLTTLGFETAQNIARILEAEHATAPANNASIKMHEKSKTGKMVTHIRTSNAYKKYMNNKARNTLSDYDICSMLLCTLDAPTEVKIKNLHSFQDEAKTGNWNEVAGFLFWVEKKFGHLFVSESRKRKGMYG